MTGSSASAAYLALALALAACSDDPVDPPPAAGDRVTVRGTAAVGAPIANAPITALCRDGSSSATAATAADGSFSVQVARAALPCVLAVTSGGVELRSLATAEGVANITPLTELILARVAADRLGQSLDASLADPASLDALAAGLAAGADALRAALVAAGYPVPPSWTAGSTAPFTVEFVASTTDPYDALLEVIAAAGVPLAQLVSSFALGMPLPMAPSGSTDPMPMGDGSVLAGGEGATGTLAGTTHTFRSDVRWAVLPGQGWGSFAANHVEAGGGVDPLTSWQIAGLPATVGTHRCKSSAVGPRIQLVLASVNHDTAPEGGSCIIEIISVSSGAITARFSATLVRVDGTVAGVVTDGFIRKEASTGGGTPLMAGEVGASFDVEGQTHKYLSAYSLAFENFAGMTAAPADASSPGSPVGLQLHTVPNQTGTFACDSHQGNEYRKLNVWFFWNGVMHTAGARTWNGPGQAGSSCSVTVSQAGTFTNGQYVGTFEGSFSGTFVSADGMSTVVVTNGLFRYQGMEYQVPEFVTRMAGSYAPVVIEGNQFLGYDNGDVFPVRIANDGTIHAGSLLLEPTMYSSQDNTRNLREPGVVFSLPPKMGESFGTRLTVFVGEDGRPVQFRLEAEVQGIRRQIQAAVRPIPPANAAFIADLIAGGPYALKRVGNVFEPNNQCGDFSLAINAGSADPNNPYFEFIGPSWVERYSDVARLTMHPNGDRTLGLYYSKVTLKPNGSLELIALGGNGQDTDDRWTNDPAVLATACP